MSAHSHCPPFANRIASTVIATFDSLPRKFKPPYPSDSSNHNWIPLAGIVLTGLGPEAQAKCVALGTGMKCLAANKVPTAKGIILHDWHAEIVAMRAFNLFLIEEIRVLMEAGHSDVVAFANLGGKDDGADKQPFIMKSGVDIHMYSSEAPCGDASMELVMQRQRDASPWPLPKVDRTGSEGYCMLGRGHFSELGIVRRKPCT